MVELPEIITYTFGNGWVENGDWDRRRTRFELRFFCRNRKLLISPFGLQWVRPHRWFNSSSCDYKIVYVHNLAFCTYSVTWALMKYETNEENEIKVKRDSWITPMIDQSNWTDKNQSILTLGFGLINWRLYISVNYGSELCIFCLCATL